MATVGLTGGIASGKSTVSGEFEKLGTVVIDADKIARELISPQRPLWRKVINYFGEGICNEDLTIDRLKLGRKIFARRREREALDRIMHPEIEREIDRRCREVRARNPGALVLVDAALLIETGIFREMDKVIVVSASRRTQMRRLVDRNGLAKEEAIRRIRAQMPLKEKLKYADYVINTDGSLEEIRQQVRKIHGDLMALRQGYGGHRRIPLQQWETGNECDKGATDELE